MEFDDAIEAMLAARDEMARIERHGVGRVPPETVMFMSGWGSAAEMLRMVTSGEFDGGPDAMAEWALEMSHTAGAIVTSNERRRLRHACERGQDVHGQAL